MEYKIRPFTLDDVDSFVKHANNKNISAFMTNRFPNPYTRKDGEEFINRFKDKDPQQIFAIEIEGEAAGAIGVHPMEDIFCKNAEISYWVSEQYWGKGITTKAIGQIVDYAFKTFEINRIFGRVYGNNPASKRVLEKAGFTLEAHYEKTIYKNGEFLDELILAIRI